MIESRKSKAIIFDIDGTAIDSPTQKIPTERLVEAVRKVEKTYFLCAATGRVWTFAEPVLKGMELVDPSIISSGTQICDPKTGEIFWQTNIDEKDVEKVISVLRRFPDFKVLYNDYREEDYLFGGISPEELSINEPAYFIEQIFIPEDKASDVVSALSEIEGITCTMVVAQRPGYKDLHITNRLATKEHAIAELLRILKIDRSDTIGIGDGHNDIHVFNAVEHKVAMENAVDELKGMADEVIGSVRQDGMAGYLEKLSEN